MQVLAAQKQQFQAQLFEIEGALREIDSSSDVYKVIGGLMLRSEKDALKQDLQNKKEMLEIRLESLEKQESQLRKKKE